MKARCRQCELFHNVRIDFATEKDFGKLRSFLGTYLGEGLRKEDMNSMLVVRLDYNSKIIGCLQTVAINSKFAYLTRLKVAKPFRRQGLAEELMTRRLQIVRRVGFQNIYAVTLMKGPEKLVRKLGAKEITKTQMTKHVPIKMLKDYSSKNGNKFWRLPYKKYRA